MGAAMAGVAGVAAAADLVLELLDLLEAELGAGKAGVSFVAPSLGITAGEGIGLGEDVLVIDAETVVFFVNGVVCGTAAITTWPAESLLTVVAATV